MQKFVINKFDSNQSLFKYIKKILKNAPLSFVYRIFRKKDCKVNGKRESDKYVLQENDEVILYISDDQYKEFTETKALTANDQISNYIIYEDDNLIFINKPRGMLVQGDGSRDVSLDVLVNEYLLFKGKTGNFLSAPCHRIDRNTSGIVVFAKSIEITQEMTKLIKEHEDINKTYLTLVKGNVKEKGQIDAPLIKNEKLNKVFVGKIEDGAKESKTLYEKVYSNGEVSLLKVKLLTGRSHQIRVHMAYIGNPVVGDQKYGDFVFNKEFENKYKFKNQFLHAYELEFKNLQGNLKYLSGKTFKALLPEDEDKILNCIKGENGYVSC